MDEYDVATYTIKTLDDPRTLNKTVYLRPPANILSQRELVEMWEKLSGKILEKITISDKDFLASIQGVYVISLTTLTYLLSDLTWFGLIWNTDYFHRITNFCIELDYVSQVGVGHFYHIFYEGCLTNFEITGEDEEEASKLYPEVPYKRMHQYLKLYV